MKQEIIVRKCELAKWGYYARLRTVNETNITATGTYGDTPEQAEANLRKLLISKNIAIDTLEVIREGIAALPGSVDTKVGIAFTGAAMLTLCVIALLVPFATEVAK